MNILIAIPTYKRPDFFPDCIEAVMRQAVTNATLTVLMACWWITITTKAQNHATHNAIAITSNKTAPSGS